ncbi:phosphohydrolase [Halomonas sp. 1513]|nr:TraI domain-containing protein [Halomonas sp. 1513]APX91786.1 phosphohydrolase [Halomonas sp. 1513]
MMLNDVPKTTAKPFSGTFRLTGRVVDFDQHGTPYLKIRLSNCDTDHIGGFDIEHTHFPEEIGYLDQVVVSGDICPPNPINLDVKINNIRRASLKEAVSQPVLNSLPQVYCSAPESLEKLIQSVRSLNSHHLQEFVRRVIERKDRMEAFLNAPASRSHHHAYPGGLLDHSLDVAKNVVAMAQINEPEMPRTLKEVGFVAGLFHDIGKTYTYDSKGKPNAAWSLCSHDALTLEACAFGLAYLDRHLPELAVTLRHIWTSASPGARYGHQPATTLARYVRDADGQSSMSHRQAAIFQFSGSGLIKKGKDIFWSPAV